MLYALVKAVSVPIWGLFNLTFLESENNKVNDIQEFPSPLGDYLI